MATGNINLSINATANAASANAALNSMAVGMRKLRSETEGFYKQLQQQGGRRDEIGFEKLKNQIDATRSQYRRITEESGLFLSTQKQLTAATTDFNDRLAKNKLRIRDIVGNSKLIHNAMKEQMALKKMMVTGWRMDATGKIDADIFVPKDIDLRGIGAMRAQLGYYNQMLKTVSEQTVNWGKNTQWAGRQLTVGFSVPITIAAGALAKFGMDADAQLVRIAKVYGDTEAAFQASNESIRNMAQDTAQFIAQQYGIAASETRTVMAELAATGLEGAELQGMTGTVQRLALLGEMTSDESLKLARVLKEVYGFSSVELNKQVDYFNAIENATALTMQDITEGLPRISGIMKSTGTSIKEQTELLVAFKSAGIDIAEGANALKSINFKAIAATPTARKSFLALTGEDMDALIRKHNAEFLPMMMEIARLMDDMSQPDKMALVQRVFGIHQGSRAITLIEQLQKGSEGMLRAQEVGMKNASELAATANQEIATIQQSVSMRFKAMVQSIKASLEPLGITVLEMIIPIGEKIADFVKWIDGLSEGAKRFGIVTALLLAATGPVVMLAGLFANLGGLIGRTIGFFGGLIAKFEILNPLAHAAQLIENALENETQQATKAMNEQTVAVGRLADAISFYNKELLASVEAEQMRRAAANGETIVAPRGPLALEESSRAARFVAGPNGIRDQFAETSRNNDRRPGLVSRKQYLSDWDDAIAENANRKLAAHNKLVEEGKEKWTKMGAAVSGTAAAISGIAMFTGNEALANISMLAMVASSLAPALGVINKRVAESMNVAINRTGTLGSKMANGIKAGAEMGRNAMAGLVQFMTGPWGLAVAGAMAGVLYLWDRHRKQVEEMREMYAKLSDSAELLSKSYDFQPVTGLERQMAMPGYDPDMLSGQQARINEMKESNTELYDLLQQRSENIRENYEGEARSREAANEAMRQGAEILRQTGDSALAKQVAWDVYNTISQEWMTFDEFKITFGADLNSLEQVADRVTETLSGRLGQMDLNVAWTGNLSKEYLAQIEADTKAAVEAINAMPNPSDRNAKYLEQFSMLTTMQEMFFTAQKNGWIDSEMTFTEYATNFESQVAKLRERGISTGVTIQDAQAWQAIATAINSVNPTAMTGVTEANMDLIEGLSGVGALYRDQVDWIKIRRLEEEKGIAPTEARKKELQDEIDLIKSAAYAEAMGIDQQRVAQERLDLLAMTTGNVVEGLDDIGDAGGDMADDIVDGAEEAKSALDMLSKPDRQIFDAYRSSMQYLQQNTVDFFRDEFQKIQDAERAAFDAQAETDMADVEARHDILEKNAEAADRRRKESLDSRHEREQELLDEEKKAADKAIKQRGELLREQQSADKKALSNRFKAMDEELKKAQEARREAIEATYDAQVQAIEDQIELEQALEKQRQEMFEAEKERINRLQSLFSSNIDLNMAINSGDLDEAARIASDMTTRQNEWMTDDLSKISQEGSQGRIDKMRGQIDTIEAQRDAELEALKDIEEAQKEALDRQQEREEEALEAKYKRLEEALEKEKENLDKAFEARNKDLDRRQKREQQALDDQLRREAEARETNRQADVQAQEDKTAKDKAELDKRLADAQAMFDMQADHWASMDAQNFDDWVKTMDQMKKDFETTHGIELPDLDKEAAKKLWDQRHRKQKYELSRMANDDSWEDAARIIVDGITKGILGVSFNAKEFAEFIKTGKLPSDKSDVRNANHGRLVRTQNSALHSGGIAGKDSSWTGPGFTGRHQEVNATLLKGEGVLNLRAMRTPGVPELIDGLNRGIVATSMKHPGKAEARPGGNMGMLPAIAGITAGIVKQMSRVAALAGLERGMTKAEQMFSGVDIQLGAEQRQGLTGEQLANASAIVTTGRRMNASDRDIIIALMTAMQESTLRNLGYGDDIHGVRNPDGTLTSSLGLFQQQKWWGTRGERLDPFKSSELFYNALFRVKDRDQMPLTMAAQEVQRSAYPNAYAKWESLARVLLGGAVNLDGSMVNSSTTMAERLKALRERYERVEQMSKGFMYPTTGMISWLYGPRNMAAMGRADFHNGLDIRAPGGTPVYATGAGRAVTGWDAGGGGNYVRIDHGNGMGTGYFHLSRKAVRQGQQVQHGQHIGNVGNTGSLSFGNHLHFAVFRGGQWQFVNPAPFMQSEPYVGKMVSPTSLAMRFGGLVPGRGRGDKVPAMLEPGEMVMRKKVADRYGSMLMSLNSGGGTAGSLSRSIDNSVNSPYNVTVNVNGPVNSEIDFKRAVKGVLSDIERRKSHSRTVSA